MALYALTAPIHRFFKQWLERLVVENYSNRRSCPRGTYPLLSRMDSTTACPSRLERIVTYQPGKKKSLIFSGRAIPIEKSPRRYIFLSPQPKYMSGTFLRSWGFVTAPRQLSRISNPRRRSERRLRHPCPTYQGETLAACQFCSSPTTQRELPRKQRPHRCRTVIRRPERVEVAQRDWA